ncbi:MAG: glycosyl hydrolase family 18 protein [Candidatus Roizmanbacteria bacterium]
MSKKGKFFLIIVGILFGSVLFYGYKIIDSYRTSAVLEAAITPTSIPPTPSPVRPALYKSVFVPYWVEWDNEPKPEGYDRVIYFGVDADINGINKQDAGYLNMPKFISYISNEGEKWITIRMTDSDKNTEVLDAKTSWKQIVNDVIAITRDNNFKGVVLDFEISALPFKDITQKISEFQKFVGSEMKRNNIPYAVAIYGDSFYRSRPYEIQKIAENASEIMVMAYDFHKSRGEPGPNFPFEGKEKYGYDFKTMLNDYMQVVPSDKLSIIYGMFGYNWMVDEKQRPIRPAVAMSLNEIKKTYIEKCVWKNCIVKRNEKSDEVEINYIDEYLNYHVVWYEDYRSVEKKLGYMLEKGIGKYTYWTWGYF